MKRKKKYVKTWIYSLAYYTHQHLEAILDVRLLHVFRVLQGGGDMLSYPITILNRMPIHILVFKLCLKPIWQSKDDSPFLLHVYW
jgi:hypothetical protein